MSSKSDTRTKRGLPSNVEAAVANKRSCHDPKLYNTNLLFRSHNTDKKYSVNIDLKPTSFDIFVTNSGARNVFNTIQEYGHIVIRNVVDAKTCMNLVNTFQSTLKELGGFNMTPILFQINNNGDIYQNTSITTGSKLNETLASPLFTHFMSMKTKLLTIFSNLFDISQTKVKLKLEWAPQDVSYLRALEKGHCTEIHTDEHAFNGSCDDDDDDNTFIYSIWIPLTVITSVNNSPLCFATSSHQTRDAECALSDDLIGEETDDEADETIDNDSDNDDEFLRMCAMDMIGVDKHDFSEPIEVEEDHPLKKQQWCVPQFPINCGDIIIFDHRAIHGAPTNICNRPRLSLDMRLIVTKLV